MSILPFLAVQEICCHEQFESDFWLDGKLWNLCRAVSVPHLVGEIHAHLKEKKNKP